MDRIKDKNRTLWCMNLDIFGFDVSGVILFPFLCTGDKDKNKIELKTP
jgi:hypothetical protein